MDYISSVEVIIDSDRSGVAWESLYDSGSHLIISPSGLSQRPTPQRTQPAKLTMSPTINCKHSGEPSSEVIDCKEEKNVSIENISDEQEIKSDMDEYGEDVELAKPGNLSRKKGLIAGIRRSAKGVKTAAVDLRKKGKSKEGRTKKFKEEQKSPSLDKIVTCKEQLENPPKKKNLSMDEINCCESNFRNLNQDFEKADEKIISHEGQNDSLKKIELSLSEIEVTPNNDEKLTETREINCLDNSALAEIWGKDRISFANSCISPFRPDEPSEFECELSSKTLLSSWCKTSGEQFSVRDGPDYAKNRKKSPSACPLYEIVDVRHFKSLKRTTHISDVLPFPTAKAFPESKVPVIKDPYVPEILVVHFNFPSEHPNVFRPKDDGEGGELILYLKPAKFFLDDLNGVHGKECSAATKLFTEWCKHCTESFEWRSRFKCMGIVRDLEKHNVSFLKPYNGKPVLIKESGKARRGVSKDGIKYLEMSANVHRWSFIAKKGFVSILPKLKEMNLDMGFTIEAFSNEEMPERMLGCILLNNIDPKSMPSISKEMQESA